MTQSTKSKKSTADARAAKNIPDAWAEKRKAGTEARTWARIAGLADAALVAIDAGNTKEARSCLNAIRGVALNADEARP